MKRHRPLAALPLALALAGVVGILTATPHGIGLTPDSISYVGGARNIVDGKGFTAPPFDQPITHRAPLYPYLLAAMAHVGPEPVRGARWLSAALFGLNLLLIWALVSRTRIGVAPAPPWVPFGVTAVALAAPPMWEIHLMAWTEPAFVSLCLAGLWLTATYLEDARLTWLVAAAASVGLATVTRYAGLSMVGACCLALLLFERQPLSRRVADAVWFAVIGLGPFALWTWRNLLVAGTATSRSIAFHPVDADSLREALTTMASWLLVPESAAGWVKAGAIVAAGAVLALRFRLRQRGMGEGPAGGRVVPRPDVVNVTCIAAVVYPLFLALSVSLADANTPLDQRILSPLFVCLLVLAASGLHAWDEVTAAQRGRRLLVAVPVCLVCLAYWGSSAPLIARSHRQGLGFSDVRWGQSGLVVALGGLPPGATLYSNAPDAVYYHAGRGARRIPTPFSSVTRTRNPMYEEELAVMAGDLERGAVLVYFELGTGSPSAILDGLVRELDLVPVQQYADGTIYARRTGSD